MPHDQAFRRRSAQIHGFTALGATMVAVTATSPIPAFWRGIMTGLWLAGTCAAIAWQVGLQWRHRQTA